MPKHEVEKMTTDLRMSLLLSTTLMTSINVQSQAVQSESVVKPQAVLSVDRAKPGLRFELAVIAEIAEGYHINAHRPGDEFLIGTDLKVEAPPGFQPGKPLYPPPQIRTYSYSPKPLAVYEKRVVIKVPLSLSRGVKPGRYILKARLRFQPCSEKLCLPPKLSDVEIPIEVVPPDQHVKRINTNVFGTGPERIRPGGR